MFLKSFQEPLKLDFKYPNATVMKVIVFVARVGMLAAEKDFLRTFLFFFNTNFIMLNDTQCFIGVMAF